MGKSVREVFRFAYFSNPDMWDWKNEAKVPSPLNEEMQKEKKEKKNDRKALLKEKMKQSKPTQEDEEETPDIKEDQPKPQENIKVAKGPQRLGGERSGTGALQGTQGLSGDALKRLEREKRLKAIEERMKRK
jgi:hypothetical protein